MSQDKSWIVQRRKGNQNDEFVDIEEILTVDFNKVTLTEILDSFKGLKVYNESKTLYTKTNGTPDENTVVVKEGEVFFHPSYNGESFTFEYSGTGGYFLNAKRIYTVEKEGKVEETLANIIEEGRDGIDIIYSINDKYAELNASETVRLNNEGNRVNKENERLQNENTRVQNEIERQATTVEAINATNNANENGTK